MQLHFIDWVIAIFCVAICFIPAFFVGKRSNTTSEFFASGRSVPWWLAGLSMVATTFSSDTPNWVTEQVRKFGVAGNWQWWAFVLTGIATVFFFARLWRRSGVLTDLEFYEVRYSGMAASVVRGFRAIYLGLFFNCFIMGMVTLAACKIANILFGLPAWETIAICGILNVVFAAHSGLWGVLVIDMVQFFIKMTAVIAAAVFSVKAVGGWGVLMQKLGNLQVVTTDGAQPVMSPSDGGGQPILDILPNFGMKELTLMIFLVPLAIQWWAAWYPGSEPGGGSYIAQRMLASKSEKDSLGAVLFFNLAHYVLRPWPWIITALCSIIIYPDLASIQAAFPNADPHLIGHDSAFPAMLKFLPVGFVGLMVGGLVAANSSTILTHLNWGSSYLVHDFYRRFISPKESEKHYVTVGRACTVVLYIVAAYLSTILSSAQQAFQIIVSIGAGTGLLYMVRWFWWRITAWCEVVAMISSFLISVAFVIIKTPFAMTLGSLVIKNPGHDIPFAESVIYSVAFTTVCWLLTAFFGPQTDQETLISFYKKVHPAGPGWQKIRKLSGVTEQQSPAHADHMGMAFVGWISGSAMIWSSLFAIGNFLYGRTGSAIALTATFIVSSAILLWTIRHLWNGSSDSQVDEKSVAEIETV